jgi:hypothetical protein
MATTTTKNRPGAHEQPRPDLPGVALTEESPWRMPGRYSAWLFAAGVVLFAIVMFHSVLASNVVLFSTDDNIGALATKKNVLPSGFLGWWDDSVLVGVPTDLLLSWSNVLLWILPLRIFTSWYHAIDLGLASVFLAFYLRTRGRSWAACAMGALAAFWVGSNMTLTFAGHLGKFAVLMFAAAFLWTCERAVRSRRISWALLSGCALGAMFLEQPDLALFFAMALGPFAVFAFVRENGFSLPAFARVLVPMGIAAALLALPSMLTIYQSTVKGVTVTSTENPQAKWEFSTQWSWPPEESVDFIAPGYMGWRSGEPEGPYWGRMGRSAGWEQTKQGFQNFKLESQYLGSIPVALALLAACGAWLAWKKDKPWSREVLFWSVVAVVSLLLSFGKYFPLYRLFYMLPAVSSIRNPNKFLQVFQLAVAILAAGGLDVAARRIPWAAELAASRVRLITVGLVAAVAVLMVWAFGLSTSLGNLVTRMELDGWRGVADIIVRNQLWAAWHGVLLAAIVAGILWALWRTSFGRKEVVRVAAVWLLAGVVVLDSLALSRHYVKPMSMDQLKQDDVLRFLKGNLQYHRVALLSQASFYNHWLTYEFPYHGIDVINVTQMPRMADDYKTFLGRIGNNPLRLWQLCGVGFVVGPAQGWQQIQNDPGMKGLFDIAYAFNVVPSGSEGFQAVPSTPTQPGQHCVLRLKAESSRFVLLAGWEAMPDESVLQQLSSPNFALFSEALIAPDDAGNIPESKGQGTCGSIIVKKCRPGDIVLQTSSDQLAFLRFAEKYHPGWQVRIDGKPVPVRRCDYLFQGVFVTPGLHEVTMQYRSPHAPLLIQAAGWVLGLAALGLMLVERKSAKSVEP